MAPEDTPVDVVRNEMYNVPLHDTGFSSRMPSVLPETQYGDPLSSIPLLVAINGCGHSLIDDF